MAVELKRLMEKFSNMDINLIAGENGLSKILLNTGPFLEKIPQEVVDFGNEKNFPIFTTPWKTHIAEVMRIFSTAITRSEQAGLEISNAFKNAIFFPSQEEMYLIPLSHHDFHANWNYFCMIVRIVNGGMNSVSQKQLENMCISIDNHLTHRNFKTYSIFYYENQIIVIAANYSDNEMKTFTNDIKLFLEGHTTKNEKFFISVGKSTKSIRCVYKSYNQALAIQNFMKNGKAPSNVIAYSGLGIFKILLGVDDKEILDEYYEKTLAPLDEYDQKNNSDIGKVLWCYLKNNGSVKDTADEMYVHRNTINYKLNRAAEILHVDLSLLDTRLQLALAFMMKEMV